MQAALANTQQPISTSTPKTTALWIGRVLGALPVMFLLFDCTIKLIKIQPVTDAFLRLGYPDHLARSIGALELICLVFYLIPRFQIVGAVLLTGFLGGAMSTHVRIEDPLATHTLFPLYIGAMLWASLLLRNPRAKAIFSE